MIQSKYLPAFEKMAAEGKEAFVLNSEFILVEEIAMGEVKSQGGIIMTTDKKMPDGFGQNKPTLATVLMVGAGYYDDETGESIPLDVKPGDIVLVGGQSIKWLSYLGPVISVEGARVGISTAGEIQLKFNGAEGYQKVYSILQGAIRGQ